MDNIVEMVCVYLTCQAMVLVMSNCLFVWLGGHVAKMVMSDDDFDIGSLEDGHVRRRL